MVSASRGLVRRFLAPCGRSQKRPCLSVEVRCSVLAGASELTGTRLRKDDGRRGSWSFCIGIAWVPALNGSSRFRGLRGLSRKEVRCTSPEDLLSTDPPKARHDLLLHVSLSPTRREKSGVWRLRRSSARLGLDLLLLRMPVCWRWKKTRVGSLLLILSPSASRMGERPRSFGGSRRVHMYVYLLVRPQRLTEDGLLPASTCLHEDWHCQRRDSRAQRPIRQPQVRGSGQCRGRATDRRRFGLGGCDVARDLLRCVQSFSCHRPRSSLLR